MSAVQSLDHVVEAVTKKKLREARIMIEAGQFLSKPGAAITFLSGLGIVGLGLLLWTLWIARRKYVARLVPAITDEGFIRAIGLGMH